MVQTGAIAAVAFVLGDYLNEIVPLGSYGPALYAGAAILLLTALNIRGVFATKNFQNFFTLATLTSVVLLVVAAFASPESSNNATRDAVASLPAKSSNYGFAMIFVLLTFGGWNEVSYLGTELKDARRKILKVLIAGLAAITASYLLLNAAYLHVLGLEGVRRSDAVAADALRAAAGEQGAFAISALISLATLTTLNATLFTGARSACAFGRDYPQLSWLGRWESKSETPAMALGAQAIVALLLVGVGAWSRNGFVAMVEYTAPVFWFFFLLSTLSLFVFRKRFPQPTQAFRVPLYPLPPVLFSLACLYMLYASLRHTGAGALWGIGVLLLGIPLFAWGRSRARCPNPRQMSLRPTPEQS